MIGQKINNYEILRPLGEGGMGAVYLAKHPFLERKAAIKILKPECASNAAYVQRFLNEARAANAIHHPNIIDIIDVGILPDSVPYMMMEFLEGESLAGKLRRVGRLSVDEAVFVAEQIASALDAAHAAGIVHRDLKPDNVFVVPDPRSGNVHIKVLDFGIAKLRPEFAPDTPRTSAGALMGTPAYMSPEQCMGKTDEIDHRADIYALGVILYECLCGRTPFEGESFGDYFLQHITVPPPPPSSFNPDIPPFIEALVLKSMAKHATDRVQSMREFSELLAGKAMPSTLSLEGEAGQRPVQRTVSLDGDEPTADNGLRGEARGGHSGRASEPGMPPKTTLSSSTGQVHTGRRTPAGSRTARSVFVAIAAALVTGAAVLLLLRPWRGSEQTGDRGTAEPAPKALPPFAAPVEEPKSTSSPMPAPEPLPVAAPEPPPAPVPASHPRPTRISSPGRERVRPHAADRDDAKKTPVRSAAAGSATVVAPPDHVPPAQQAPQTTPAPPPKTILREKF